MLEHRTMSYSSLSFRDRQSGQDVPERQLPPRMTEQSFAESLKRIVRRVLRTQSQRTGFEARILEVVTTTPAID